MNKILISILFAALFAAVCRAEDAVPPVTSPTGSYVSGRKARLIFSYKTVSGTVTWCDVYRDGELYYSGILGQKDAETNGEVWYAQSGKQYFIDTAGLLARSHVYTFVVRTAEGAVSEPVSVAVSMPQPAFAMSQPSAGSGRTISITVTPVSSSFFPDVFYEVYRDDELLATIPQKGSGSTENGDTWAWSYSTSFSFKDNNAYPGKIHLYRVVAHLFDGFSMELAGTGRVGLPAFVMGKANQTGRTVTLSISTAVSRSLFPQLVYEVYRDGEKIGEVPTNGSGTLANGDSYSFTNSAGTYADSNTTPGQIYEYTVVAVLFPGCRMEQTAKVRTTRPDFVLTSMTYSNGAVSMYYTTTVSRTAYPDYYFEVRRDGESIGTCRSGTCSVDNGNQFQWGTTNVYLFKDVNVVPGRSYLYELSLVLYDDVRITLPRIITVGLPDLSVTGSRYNATTGQLTLPLTIHEFRPQYQVYRDGEKLAEFRANSSGSDDEGRSWTSNTANQIFREANLAADQNYAYRVVAVLTDDCILENEAFVDVHPSSVGNISSLIVNDAYVPIIKRLATGEYLLGASFRNDPANPGADLTVFLGGGKFLFLDNGGVETTIPAGEFAATGLANRYFLAPATINPNRTVVNMYATTVVNDDANPVPVPPSQGNSTERQSK